MNTGRMDWRHRGRAALALSPLTLALGLSTTSPAHAGPTIQLGEDTTLAYSLTLSHTLSSRLSKPAEAFLNDLNNDDGTRNFDRGSLITNRTNVLGELRLRHDNLGAMLRASTFYDRAYRGSNDNDSPGTVNKIGPHDEFTAITRRDSGRSSRILDAYVYGNWAMGEEQYLSLKAGRHVLAWGESLFLVTGEQVLSTTSSRLSKNGARVGSRCSCSGHWVISDFMTTGMAPSATGAACEVCCAFIMRILLPGQPPPAC